ncbi:MAG: hypothetical protein E7277_05145 [Lachnospiraceae bacterium]|jgi:uncharacterized protein YcfL|nr:hypothetical protein [Lachnospiraceae bacterium]
MKKAMRMLLVNFAVFAFAISSLLLTGCGNDSKKDSDSKKETDKQENVSLSDKDFKIETDQFTHDDSCYYLMTLQNNAKVPVDVSVVTKAYDASGNELNDATDLQYAVGVGQSIALTFLFDDAEKIDSFKYELDYRESIMEPCVSDLDFKASLKDGKVVVNATNNTDYDCEFVQAVVLFYKGGKPVYTNSGYIGDSDNLLKAGATEEAQISCYEEFDAYNIFYNGRKHTEEK